MPGPDVGGDQDRPEVLRVDDLSAPGHLEDDVGERRAEHQELATGRTDDGAALAATDDVVVGEDPRVGVECLALAELQEVPTLLRVDEKHPFAVGQLVAVRHGLSSAAGRLQAGCSAAESR